MLKIFTTTIALGVLSGAAFAQTTPPPAAPGAMKMTQTECSTVWGRLDAAKSGTLAQAQAQQHVTDFKAADSNNDGTLSQAEFQAACDKGLIRSTAATGSGTDMQKK